MIKVTRIASMEVSSHVLGGKTVGIGDGNAVGWYLKVAAHVGTVDGLDVGQVGCEDGWGVEGNGVGCSVGTVLRYWLLLTYVYMNQL